MPMTIVRELRFESAHRLPNTPPGHKCQRLHGHSFRAEVHVQGPVDPDKGWVRDFGDIKEICAPLVAELDHHYLNEVPGLENPTSENIARWLWERLQPRLPDLVRIVVQETCHARAEYTG